jgi:hypothetical protein
MAAKKEDLTFRKSDSMKERRRKVDTRLYNMRARLRKNKARAESGSEAEAAAKERDIDALLEKKKKEINKPGYGTGESTVDVIKKNKKKKQDALREAARP